MDLVLPREANLVFGGVYVDVHFFIGHADKEDGKRELAFDQALGIAFKQRMLNDAVVDDPAIDKDINTP